MALNNQIESEIILRNSINIIKQLVKTTSTIKLWAEFSLFNVNKQIKLHF